MSAPACANPLTLAQLLEHWLDDPPADDMRDGIEEHLFACAPCSAQLETLVALGEGVRRLARSGGVGAVFTSRFVQRLKDGGVRVREYRMGPSEGVYCTITPEDDLVVAHLRAPLQGVTRLDLLVQQAGQRTPARLEDVPFDSASDEIVVAPATPDLRGLGTSTQRVHLVAVDEDGERALGTYTFNHTPS